MKGIITEEKIKSAEKCLYLVDWGNGFLGGFNKEYTQMFNTPSESVFDDLKRLEVKNVKIITPQELDELRGYHKPNLQEYLGV